MPDSTFQVSKGKMFYDQNFKKIIFSFTFPQKEEVVLFDTVMYAFRADTLFSRSRNFLIPEQSFFHYMLMGQISNYGLEKSNFKAKGFEKKNGMVITTWEPPDNFKKMVSKILIANKDKRLYSVTMVDPKGKVMNRQILKKYQVIDGVDIPHEILIATYYEKGQVYQIINLSNVKINEPGNDKIYNFKL
jgi:hypothetical protein